MKVNVLIYRDPMAQDSSKVRVFSNKDDAVNAFKRIITPIMDENDQLDEEEIQRLSDELSSSGSVFVDGEDEWYSLIECSIE